MNLVGISADNFILLKIVFYDVTSRPYVHCQNLSSLVSLNISFKVHCGQLHCIAIVTSISLYQLVLLDALQLATGTTGLFSQGATAVVHGCSVHALGHNLGEETGFIMATLQEGSGNARNHTRLHS